MNNVTTREKAQIVELYRYARSVIYGVSPSHIDKHIFCSVIATINFIPCSSIGLSAMPIWVWIYMFPEWIASIPPSAEVADFLGIRNAPTS